jgi:hypothetical protein
MSILSKMSRNKKVVLSIITLAVVSLGGTFAYRQINNSTLKQNATSEKSFTFAAVGDFGTGTDFTQTLQSIKASSSDFTLALGDFSYGKIQPESAWCELVTKELGADYPFQLVVGNHDEGSKPGQGHIKDYTACLPNKITPITGEYATQYWFDYNRLARFIVVSPDIQIDGVNYDYTMNSERYAWLEQAIDEARADGMPWTIVAMHETCISIGEKGCEIGEDIINLLVDKKVDLILQGHEHGYMRSKQLHHEGACTSIAYDAPLRDCTSSIQDGVFARHNGPIVVINGTGGIELRDINESSKNIDYFESWSGKNVSPAHGPSIVRVSESALEVTHRVNDGSIADRFRIE